MRKINNNKIVQIQLKREHNPSSNSMSPQSKDLTVIQGCNFLS